VLHCLSQARSSFIAQDIVCTRHHKATNGKVMAATSSGTSRFHMNALRSPSSLHYSPSKPFKINEVRLVLHCNASAILVAPSTPIEIAAQVKAPQTYKKCGPPSHFHSCRLAIHVLFLTDSIDSMRAQFAFSLLSPSLCTCQV